MRVIGLTGAPCSGKERAKDFLLELAAERGLSVRHLSFSGEIRREGVRRGMAEQSLDRDAIIRLVADMRAQEGPGVLAKRLVQHVREAPADVIVAEAVRHPAEADVLRAAFGRDFVLAAVVADVETMVRRLLARSRPDESRTAKVSPDAARELIRRELDGGPDTTVHVGRCIALADIVLENDGTLDDLRRAVRTAFAPLLPRA